MHETAELYLERQLTCLTTIRLNYPSERLMRGLMTFSFTFLNPFDGKVNEKAMILPLN